MQHITLESNRILCAEDDVSSHSSKAQFWDGSQPGDQSTQGDILLGTSCFGWDTEVTKSISPIEFDNTLGINRR